MANEQTRDRVLSYYDAAAHERDGFYDGDRGAYYQVQKWLKKNTMQLVEDAESVLDVGCGNGDFCEMLVKRSPGTRCFGIDISPEMIRVAKERSQRGAWNAEFQVGEMSDLPFGDQSFDCITSIGVFLHVPLDRRAKVCAEFCRVAKHSVIIEIKNSLSPYYPIKWLKARFGRMRMRIFGASVFTLSRLMRPHGFKIVSERGVLPGRLGSLVSPVVICEFRRESD